MWFYLHDVPRVVKFRDIENGMVVAGGWGEGREEIIGYLVQNSFWEDESFEKECGDGCIAM